MRFLMYLVAGIAVTAGCQGLPWTPKVVIKPRLADRDAIAKVLPRDLTLEQVVQADGRFDEGSPIGKDGQTQFVNPITLEEKLIAVGARVGQDDKLRDATGKEIYFYHIKRYGTPAPYSHEEEEASRKLFDTYRVIEIDDVPGGPLPC